MHSPFFDLLQNGTDALPAFLSFVVAIVVAITIHEFAHAKAAQMAGDPTATMQGRVTLNPLMHFDPIGTIALLFAGFGWGKPVPVNPLLMRNPRRDNILVSLWGPLSNFIAAALFALPLRFNFAGQYVTLLFYLVSINLVLGIFNLIPIYPLDGSHILSGLLPLRQAQRLEAFYHQYGMLLLLVLIMTRMTQYLIGFPMKIALFLLIGININ